MIQVIWNEHEGLELNHFRESSRKFSQSYCPFWRVSFCTKLTQTFPPSVDLFLPPTPLVHESVRFRRHTHNCTFIVLRYILTALSSPKDSLLLKQEIELSIPYSSRKIVRRIFLIHLITYFTNVQIESYVVYYSRTMSCHPSRPTNKYQRHVQIPFSSSINILRKLKSLNKTQVVKESINFLGTFWVNKVKILR